MIRDSFPRYLAVDGITTVVITSRAELHALQDTVLRKNKTGSRINVFIIDNVQEVKEAARDQRTAFIQNMTWKAQKLEHTISSS